jgi:hypothetical protein
LLAKWFQRSRNAQFKSTVPLNRIEGILEAFEFTLKKSFQLEMQLTDFGTGMKTPPIPLLVVS